jgi:hypothetical protein
VTVRLARIAAIGGAVATVTLILAGLRGYSEQVDRAAAARKQADELRRQIDQATDAGASRPVLHGIDP